MAQRRGIHNVNKNVIYFIDTIKIELEHILITLPLAHKYPIFRKYNMIKLWNGFKAILTK